MSKNLVEPGLIATAFTVGALVNRRRRNGYDKLDDPISGRSTPLSFRQEEAQNTAGGPDNSVFRDNLTSRFLATFPFLLEIWYWNLTYWVYQLARAFSATMIRESEATFALAETHAIRVLSLEKTLGIAIEQPLQHYILTSHPYLVPLVSNVYYSHIVLGVCFIAYTYTYLPFSLFSRIRRSIALNNWLAFIVLTIYRCKPPRLMPDEYGFVDVLHGGQKHSAWTQNRFQLTIAAMPSLHFGTAAFLGYCAFRWAPHRIIRTLGPVWPMLMLFTIVTTANHFILDAFVGGCIVCLGWRWNEIWLLLQPLEERLFWLLRTEKPLPYDGRVGYASPTVGPDRKSDEWPV